jgi:serine protease SohB
MSDQVSQKSSVFFGVLSQWPVVGRLFRKGPKVSVIRLSGVIADTPMKKKGLSYNKLAKIIDKAFTKSDTAVALEINSPGGAAAQSSMIANLIRQKSNEHGIPVFSFIEDVAASGGYWLACSADSIYAQPSSIVGSIGVISASFGFEDFIANHGVKRRVYSAGTDKSFLDPFLEVQDKDVKRLQAAQKHIHKNFIEWVKERRGKRLKGTDKTLFEGQFWTGQEALDKGMVDGIGGIRELLAERFGDDINFLEFSPEKKAPFPLSLIKYPSNTNLSDDIIADFLDTIASKAHWSRYGL